MKPSVAKIGDECWRIVLALNPVPAARPRVGKFGTYYPKTYSRFKIQADEQLVPFSDGVTPTTELLYVHCLFVSEKPRTSKLPAPNGDIDNFVKAALDAVTKAQVMWSDDRQIVGLHAQKRWAWTDEEPCIILTVGLTAGAVWEDVNGFAPNWPMDLMDIYERVELK